MLASMTGFSTKSITIQDNSCASEPNKTIGVEPLKLTIMLKSLNSRFFEASCKLPFALTHLETEIIKQLRTKLIRGSLQVFIQTAQPNALRQSISPAFDLAEKYVNGLKEIQERCKLAGTFTISDLIHLPHLFEQTETTIDEQSAQEILRAIDEIAQALMQTRQAEGKSLEADIVERLTHITIFLDTLKRRAIIAIQNRKDQALANFENVFAQTPGDIRDQQLQLLQAQMIRYEINEEIVRFGAHLDNLNKTIADSTLEKGKKIDFTLQELFREINTIGSKANDIELSGLVIAIKVELEKIREQAQNIL